MSIIHFFQGILIGLAITIPLGPIVLLCIQRTLTRGRRSGFISGMGSTTADVIYTIVAGLGIYSVSHFLLEHQVIIRIFGSVLLILFGLKIFLSKKAIEVTHQEAAGSYIGDYFSTLLLTLANPVTIAIFPVLFASLHIQGVNGNPLAVFTIVAGLLVGATTWWALLTLGVRLLETKIIKYLALINKVLGLLLVIFGIGTILYLFFL